MSVSTSEADTEESSNDSDLDIGITGTEVYRMRNTSSESSVDNESIQLTSGHKAYFISDYYSDYEGNDSAYPASTGSVGVGPVYDVDSDPMDISAVKGTDESTEEDHDQMLSATSDHNVRTDDNVLPGSTLDIRNGATDGKVVPGTTLDTALSHETRTDNTNEKLLETIDNR